MPAGETSEREVLEPETLECLRKHQDWFTTGDLAKACGTTLRAIRHYERLGLISSSGRSSGRHRVFAPSELDKVRLISDLRQLGVGLSLIGEMFGVRDCSTTGRQASRRVRELVDEQVAALDRRISCLRRTRSDLLELIGRLHICMECDLPLYDDRCQGCDRIDRTNLPRLLRLLWLRDGTSLASPGKSGTGGK